MPKSRTCKTSPRRTAIGLSIAAVLILNGCLPAAEFAPADPATAQVHLDRGLDLLQSRDFKAAKQELSAARPFQTGDTRALMGLAIAADMEGDFRTADRAYAALMTRGVDQAQLFNNMGYSYMLRGDLVQAAAYLAEAARRAPEDPTIRNNLAMLKKVAPL